MHVTQLPTALIAIDQVNNENMNSLLELISTVRKLKTEQQLSLKTELQTLKITAPTQLHAVLKAQENIIMGVTNARSITYATVDASELVAHDDLWSANVIINS